MLHAVPCTLPIMRRLCVAYAGALGDTKGAQQLIHIILLRTHMQGILLCKLFHDTLCALKSSIHNIAPRTGCILSHAQCWQVYITSQCFAVFLKGRAFPLQGRLWLR